MWAQIANKNKNKEVIEIKKKSINDKVIENNELNNTISGSELFDILLNDYFFTLKENLRLTGILECQGVLFIEFIKKNFNLDLLEKEYNINEDDEVNNIYSDQFINLK